MLRFKVASRWLLLFAGDPGTVCPGGSGAPLPVRDGYYTLDQAVERPCQSGSFCIGNRVRLCTQGSYSDRPGASVCLNCPVGKSSGVGAVGCEPCKVGKVASINGTEACWECLPGSFIDQPGGTVW